jgi:hypothetical protein
MGKSTAAEVLVRDHGYVHLNFADPLREVCHLVYGVSYEEMLDPVLKETVLERWPFKAPRELLQQIGTDLFRNYIPETWVESWKMKVRQLAEGSAVDGNGEPIECAGVVCSDCRFLNEAAAVHEMGATLIKIEDPRKVRSRSGGPASVGDRDRPAAGRLDDHQRPHDPRPGTGRAHALHGRLIRVMFPTSLQARAIALFLAYLVMAAGNDIVRGLRAPIPFIAKVQ